MSGAALLVADRALASIGADRAAPGEGSDGPPTDPIRSLAESLEFDPEQIFRFVTDEIRYEPYAGALRGARGTLWSRAGNSVDQALLLGALLTAAGVIYRLATGSISDATVNAITSAATSDVAGLQDDVLVALRQETPSRAPRPSPLPSVPSGVDQAAADAIVAWGEAQLGRHIATISDALAGVGITLPLGPSPVPDRERRQHVWLQMASGPDWIDLDPVLPGAQSGVALSASSSVMDDIPDDLRHTVEIAVINETVANGRLAESTAMSVTTNADELAGKPIMYLNVTPEGLKAVGLAISGLEGKKNYQPALVIGDASYVGPMPVTFSIPGGVLDGGDTPYPPDGEATAQWLQITIHSPDVAPVEVRRTIFDRIGAVSRASGPPDLGALTPVELADVGNGPPGEYQPAQTIHWLVAAGGALDPASLLAPEEPADDARVIAQVGRFFHLLESLAGAAWAVPGGALPFHDAPNIMGVSLATSGTLATPKIEYGLDIWHRSHATAGVRGASPTTSPGVVAGVLGHVVERILAGDPSSAAGHAIPSVGAIFDQAASEGIALVVVTDVGTIGQLGLAADSAARLGSRVTSGLIAIVPSTPVKLGTSSRIGWWLVDPATGRTIDEMDDGRGVAGDEYAVTLTPAQVAAAAFKERLDACLLVAFGHAVAVLGLGGVLEAAYIGGGLGVLMAGGFLAGSSAGATGAAMSFLACVG